LRKPSWQLARPGGDFSVQSSGCGSWFAATNTTEVSTGAGPQERCGDGASHRRADLQPSGEKSFGQLRKTRLGSRVLRGMLRINQNQNAAGAKSYYSTADYYSEGQELAGNWRGMGARMLGLEGTIDEADWNALCEQRNPRTGEPLAQRRRDNRTIGYDFNFHVPKSVSVLYALSEDERLLDAFRASVDETMRDVESDMQTRVRKGGRNEDRHTGNMLWGEFVHLTARPVGGVPDPHLHAHCFAFNATFDAQEQAWKAGQFRDLKRDAPYYEALFHARLSRRLAELGLPVERSKHGWEIAGVPQEVLGKFSRRTAQIEGKAAELGIDDPAAKSELGARTRSRKASHLTFPELQHEWRGRLTVDEQDAIARVEKLLGGDARPSDGSAARRAVDFALAHEFERRSVVPERQLIATALRQGVGHATPQQVREHLDARQLLVHEHQGRRMATTHAVLGEERRIVAFARDGRGACEPLGKSDRPIERAWLNASQQAAVRHVLASCDRVTVVRGAAGVGKTSLMQEAVAAIDANGTKVLAFAPTADASRGVLRREGFWGADTVARLLVDEGLQQAARGQVIWIDEAGLLGTKTTAQLFDLADRLGARVLLTGDRRQHGSVERGALLRLLEEEAGITPADVKEIQRQRGEYKSAIKAMSDGNVGEGFRRLDKLGWIREIPHEDRYRQLAADYVDAIAAGKSALVVSPTHAEKDRVTSEIRRQLKERGIVGRDERPFLRLVNAQLTEAERSDSASYAPGDVLQFHRSAKGYRPGQRVQVDGQTLPLDCSKRFSVFHSSTLRLAVGDTVRITHNGHTKDGRRLNNGTIYRVAGFDKHGDIVLGNGWTVSRDFGHLAYGTVVTSHGSQGKTVDRVFVAQSTTSLAASSREQFYVSCSRARESVTIYCDDKTALRDAVSQSEERVTATELAGRAARAVVDLHRRHASLAPLPVHEMQRINDNRLHEGASYER
jgi:conjugative relaxase-like TrwC/TraI family protein